MRESPHRDPAKFDSREDASGLTRPFAERLLAMIEADLVTYRELVPWAGELARHIASPPQWLRELAATTPRSTIIEVVWRFAHGEPVEWISMDTWVDEYVASLYLRYERRELSWATFLRTAGEQADASGGRTPCEYFYKMLNRYDESYFAESVEAEQRPSVEREYADVIQSVRRTFEPFRRFWAAGGAQ